MGLSWPDEPAVIHVSLPIYLLKSKRGQKMPKLPISLLFHMMPMMMPEAAVFLISIVSLHLPSLGLFLYTWKRNSWEEVGRTAFPSGFYGNC